MDRPPRRRGVAGAACGDRAGARRRGHARKRVVRRRRRPEPRQSAHRHRRLRSRLHRRRGAAAGRRAGLAGDAALAQPRLGPPEPRRLHRALGREGAKGDGWPGLLVGDMGQPRGGPMLTGHASHQIGLDVDVWLTPMPEHTLTRDEREGLSAVSMLRTGVMEVDPARFGRGQAALVRRAALFPEVERIFVNPAIKRTLCEAAARPRLAGQGPALVRARRPHARPAALPARPAALPRPGPAARGRRLRRRAGLVVRPGALQEGPAVPAKPVTLVDLPPACTGVLHEP